MLLKSESSKELNRRVVLERIRGDNYSSRSEIVAATGLSKAAVSSIVAELIDVGLVEESGSQSTVVGRPRILLSLIPQAGLALGAELTSTECRVVLTDLQATPLRYIVQPVRNADISVEPMLDLLEECVAQATAGFETEKILGLGITVPGVVDPSSGTVMLSIILPWRNVSLLEPLAARFPYPVGVFSRGSAATWGERWYGAGQDVVNMLYVRVGSGLVAGLVINGQPYLGQGFGAGELGHVTVQPEGALCRCGNRGCLATVATSEALLNRVRHLLREDRNNSLWLDLDNRLEYLTLDDVLRAAQAGNPVAEEALAELGRWLAIALASAINLLNLDMIIVGGPVSAADELLLQPLRDELNQRALPTHMVRVEVMASTLKSDAPSIGAASLILHELMSPVPMPIMPANFGKNVSLFSPNGSGG